MNGPRDIRITLTHDEFVALREAVSERLAGEWDEDTDDLDSAEAALNRAWHRWQRRQAVRA
jgi:hypothetical protein